MKMKDLRRQALIHRLKDTSIEIEMILNQLNALEVGYPEVPRKMIYHESMSTYCDLEIALTIACLIIRKLSENSELEIDDARREDINALIHSTYFRYLSAERMVRIKTRKGLEVVYLDDILKLIQAIVDVNHLS